LARIGPFTDRCELIEVESRLNCCEEVAKFAAARLPAMGDDDDGGRLLLTLSTACALLSFPPTILLIRSHLNAWERPELQLRVVRIILMVRSVLLPGLAVC